MPALEVHVVESGKFGNPALGLNVKWKGYAVDSNVVHATNKTLMEERKKTKFNFQF